MASCKYPLHTAAELGDVDRVRELLEHGRNVNCLDYWPYKTPLHYACEKGHVAVVRELLKFKASLSKRDWYGYDPLHCACKGGHLSVVRVLVSEFSADLTTLGYFGQTALMVAARGGHDDLVLALLRDYHCPVTGRDRDGWTVLHHACANGSVNIVRTLVREHKADVNVRDKHYDTPLHVAYEAGRYDIALTLVSEFGCDPNTVISKEGFTLLHYACKSGAMNIVRDLIRDFKADVNARDEHMDTPLHVAAMSGHYEIVLALVSDFGCDPNVSGSKGYTVLHHACQSGAMNIVRALILNCKANVNACDEHNDMPLHVAAWAGRYEIALALVSEFGCDPNAVGGKGYTLLHHACKRGAIDIVRTLICDCMADVNIRSEQKEVDKQNRIGRSALMLASGKGHAEVAKVLLDYGAEVDMQDGIGRSALIIASDKGHNEVTKLLLDYGAQVDIQCNDGWSALMYAVKAGDLQHVELLIAHDASIHLKNSKGQTVFDISSSNKYSLELHQILLKKVTSSLKIESNYPGVLFFNTPITVHLTSLESSIGGIEDMGISVFVPQNSLSSEESTDITIHPCFTGPFELPDDFRPASPAYLIHIHKKIQFQKLVTVKIHHYANLQSEEDCEDMAFLSAALAPEYRGSHPVYIFKESQKSKGRFNPGDQVGEISLRHFCLLRAGKRKRKKGENYYSARLYRSVECQGIVSAVFCICLYDRMYIEHCDGVIGKQYTGGCSVVLARILEDLVKVHSSDPTVTFDMLPQILKRDIDIPNEIAEPVDYPPRLTITVRPSATAPKYVEVKGLDRECTFYLIPAVPFTTQPVVGNEGDTRANQQSSLIPIEANLTEISASSIPINALSSSISQTGNFPPPEATSDIVQHEVTRSTLIQEPVTAGAVDDNELNIDDLGDVLDEVESISSKWRLLSTKLRVKESSLDTIEQNCPRDVQICLHRALGEWLRLNYNHQRHGRPSWKKLAEAVNSIDCALSENIIKRHTVPIPLQLCISPQ